jgi:Holliday junction DNA helicase RuvA
MFYHLEGVVSDIEQNLIVLDCAGIGFAVNASMNTIAAVHSGEIAKLYISESVREDAFDLYGFASKEEKRCFEMLIGISGVGPKAAISILSSNTPGTLALAVLNGDVKSLTAAPGIGKKIAQRIVLELKDKIAKESASGALDSALPASVPAQPAESSAQSDAIAALLVLGYSMPEINGALQKVQAEGMNAEQLVKAVLRAMMQR